MTQKVTADIKTLTIQKNLHRHAKSQNPAPVTSNPETYRRSPENNRNSCLSAKKVRSINPISIRLRNMGKNFRIKRYLFYIFLFSEKRNILKKFFTNNLHASYASLISFLPFFCFFIADLFR